MNTAPGLDGVFNKRNRKRILILIVVVACVSVVFAYQQRLGVFISSIDLSLGRIEAVSESKLSGAFMYLPTLPTSSIPQYLDELKGLGMDTVILASTRLNLSDCNTANFAWHADLPGKLGAILENAQSRGMSIYVGLVYNVDACPNFYYEPNASQTVTDTATTVGIINNLYGNYPAFAGWYIPDEPNMAWTYPDLPYAFYRNIVNAIRGVSNKPILIAPYLYGSTNLPPSQLASKALDLRNRTGVNIQVWQDSVGSGGVNMNPVRGYTLNDYYTAIANSIGRDALWSDNELFNCCTAVNFAGGSYRPAGISRVVNQLNQSGATSKKVSWLPQYHMGSVDASRFPEADRLLAAYRAWYGLQGGYEYIRPQSYRWITSPAVQYADFGNELINGKTGPSKLYFDNEWVGVFGRSEFIVDLGVTKNVAWIAVHTINDNKTAIRLPSKLTVGCSTDNTNWSGLVIQDRTVTLDNSEYMFGNTSRVNRMCRYLKVVLDNDVWTFISEVEIIGGVPTPTQVPTMTPTPTPTPPPSGSLSCSPSSQTVAVGQWATLKGFNGSYGYNWYTYGGNPSSGKASTFITQYSTSGTKSILLQSGLSSVYCTVTVVK